MFPLSETLEMLFCIWRKEFVQIEIYIHTLSHKLYYFQMALCGRGGYINKENSLYNKTNENEDTEALKNINQDDRNKYINIY